MHLFSIYDEKAMVYSNPFVANSDVEAQRIFTDMIVFGGDNLISKHPSDYSLYRICDYDNKSGIVVNSQVIFVQKATVLRDLYFQNIKSDLSSTSSHSNVSISDNIVTDIN